MGTFSIANAELVGLWLQILLTGERGPPDNNLYTVGDTFFPDNDRCIRGVSAKMRRIAVERLPDAPICVPSLGPHSLRIHLPVHDQRERPFFDPTFIIRINCSTGSGVDADQSVPSVQRPRLRWIPGPSGVLCEPHDTSICGEERPEHRSPVHIRHYHRMSA